MPLIGIKIAVFYTVLYCKVACYYNLLFQNKHYFSPPGGALTLRGPTPKEYYPCGKLLTFTGVDTKRQMLQNSEITKQRMLQNDEK